MMENSRDRYPHEPPVLPSYQISPELKRLVLVGIGLFLVNFLIAGSLAIGMRILQTDVPIFPVDSIEHNVLFYALLTAHGQVMFFGVASLNTIWFAYYGTSKWGRKPLSSLGWAKASVWVMEAAVVLIFLSALFGFGGGWYNLMPLTFLPGTYDVTWGTGSAVMFLTADVLVGISLTIFCVVILTTLLRGKLPTGVQKMELYYERQEGGKSAKKEEVTQNEHEGDEDFDKFENLPAPTRWVALLGISAWFKKESRIAHPAFPIMLVAAFVTAMVQIIGNPGLFLQLASGFSAIQNPITGSNWLLTKDAWWFFAHPIVYFPLLIFLGGVYAFMPKYAGGHVSYSKWNHRPWVFYFAFSILVFAHHVFYDMPNPAWLGVMSQTASLGIVFPSSLTVMTILLFLWRSNMSWNVTSRFFLAGIAGWVFGGFQGSEMGMWGTDIYMHNTMALPGHIHMMVLLGPVLMTFGVIYAILPDLTKKHMSKTLGEIHFWLTLFGGFGFAILFNIIGTEGAIRREANMPGVYDWAMPWLLFFALAIGIAQFIFVYNLTRTLKRKATAIEEVEHEQRTSRTHGPGSASAA